MNKCTNCKIGKIIYDSVKLNTYNVEIWFRFLVTFKDSDNEFRTGRTHPRLVLITVSNHDLDHIALDAPGMKTLYVKMPDVNEKTELKLL